MTNLKRSNFQAHPFHLVSPSPWPLNNSGTLLSLTITKLLTMHGFSGASFFLFLAFFCLILSISLWLRDVISEGTYLGNHTLAVQRGLHIGNNLYYGSYKAPRTLALVEFVSRLLISVSSALRLGANTVCKAICDFYQRFSFKYIINLIWKSLIFRTILTIFTYIMYEISTFQHSEISSGIFVIICIWYLYSIYQKAKWNINMWIYLGTILILCLSTLVVAWYLIILICTNAIPMMETLHFAILFSGFLGYFELHMNPMGYGENSMGQGSEGAHGGSGSNPGGGPAPSGGPNSGGWFGVPSEESEHGPNVSGSDSLSSSRQYNPSHVTHPSSTNHTNPDYISQERITRDYSRAPLVSPPISYFLSEPQLYPFTSGGHPTYSHPVQYPSFGYQSYQIVEPNSSHCQAPQLNSSHYQASQPYKYYSQAVQPDSSGYLPVEQYPSGTYPGTYSASGRYSGKYIVNLYPDPSEPSVYQSVDPNAAITPCVEYATLADTLRNYDGWGQYEGTRDFVYGKVVVTHHLHINDPLNQAESGFDPSHSTHQPFATNLACGLETIRTDNYGNKKIYPCYPVSALSPNQVHFIESYISEKHPELYAKGCSLTKSGKFALPSLRITSIVNNELFYER